MPDICIQLIARARLCSLYGRQNQRDPTLCKYDRESLLGAFDGLHTRQKTMGIEITTDDFPLRIDPVRRRRRRRDIIDMNEDSDGEVGDGEVGDVTLAPATIRQGGYANVGDRDNGIYVDDGNGRDGLAYIHDEANQETLTTENDSNQGAGGSYGTDDLDNY